MESQTVVDLQAREIRSQKAEIRRLRRALEAMVVDTEDEVSDASPSKASEKLAVVPDSADEVELEKERGWSSGWSDESEEDEPTMPDVPFFDGEVYRCVECGWEVVDGECALAGCGKSYVLPTNPPEDTDTSQPLENLAVHPDRSLVPRGTTPVLSYRTLKDVEGPPPTYTSQFGPSRGSEYRDLRRRGATRLMCEKFRLSFTYEAGIYALANPDLYEEFAGPKMKLGDTWMIHLGRRVQLDSDDLDGSAFIKGLLEDAIYFPLAHLLSKRDFEKWDTIEETPGVWVTKLIVHKTEEEIGEDDSDSESYLEDIERCKDADAESEEALMKRGVDSDADDRPLTTNDYESDSSLEEDDDEDGSEGSGPKEPPYDKLMDYYPGLTKHDDAWSASEGPYDPDGEDRYQDPFGEGPHADVDTDGASSCAQSESSGFESARLTGDESRAPSPDASVFGS